MLCQSTLQWLLVGSDCRADHDGAPYLQNSAVWGAHGLQLPWPRGSAALPLQSTLTEHQGPIGSPCIVRSKGRVSVISSQRDLAKRECRLLLGGIGRSVAAGGQVATGETARDSEAGQVVDLAETMLEVGFALVRRRSEYRADHVEPAELNPISQFHRRHS